MTDACRTPFCTADAAVTILIPASRESERDSDRTGRFCADHAARILSLDTAARKVES